MGLVVIRGPVYRKLAIDIVINGGTFKDSALATGFGENYVRQICTKAGIHTPKCRHNPKRKEQIMPLYEKGMTTDEIARVLEYKNSTMVSAIIRKNGGDPKSDKQKAKEIRNGQIVELRKKQWSQRMIADELGITEEIVRLVCKNNGLNKKMVGSVGVGETRTCPKCGKEFECAPTHNKKYCSQKCERASAHEKNDIERRIRKKTAKKDVGITIRAIYNRDNGVCHICGKKTDWNSYRIINNKKCSYGNYPTRDHVIPLAVGGTDTWDNVRLACFKCNARKGVKLCG